MPCGLTDVDSQYLRSDPFVKLLTIVSIPSEVTALEQVVSAIKAFEFLGGDWILGTRHTFIAVLKNS